MDSPAMTCRPLPLPSLAPSMIPGRSRSWGDESITPSTRSLYRYTAHCKTVAPDVYLYLSPLVADDAGHRGEGGELVGRHLRVHPRQVTEQGGLPHRREAHKPDTGITSFGHIKTWRNRRGYEETSSRGAP